MMTLHRDILDRLAEWKNSEDRLPLLIRGARQIGKTWSMREFGKRCFEKTAYFNFESNIDLQKEFKITKDPHRLISILEVYCGFKIVASDTLIIFDEIQECNEALNSLKYFAEGASDYYVVAAGSLLGVALDNNKSFPVGKVDIINMYPLTFKEFLMSAEASLVEIIDTHIADGTLPFVVQSKIEEWFRKYQVCGGIPKPVLAMLRDRSLEEVDAELNKLLDSYSLDFSKHASSSDAPKITAIWNSIPSQLAKENRKFIYGVVREGARAREYEKALNWLELSGLLYKIYDTELPFLPLKAYDNLSAFKLYLFDVGLLRALSQLPPTIFTSEIGMFREFKGAFAENIVLQNLVPQFPVLPRYWTSAGRAEIDFILQYKDGIYPIEIKASNNNSSKSLKLYIDKYGPRKAIIISKDNFSIEEKIIRLSHGLTPWLKELLGG